VTSWAEGRREAALWRDYERSEAEQVSCPECEAPVGERCRNVHDGQPLGRLPAHWRRLKAAEVES
jgi:hypothetical protein